MDDQFNGRTDDDLFADDFEPVTPAAVPQDDPIKYETAPVEIEPVASTTTTSTEESVQPAQQPPVHRNAPRSLAQSRHAPKPAHQSRPRKHSPKPSKPDSIAPEAETQPPPVSSPSADVDPTAAPSTGDAPPNAPTAPAAAAGADAAKPGSNTASGDRTASGSNPRTKLTESELAAKMEKMRILAAEKTRKFEQAEQDSRSHALAYEKGMEEARKRRAEEAERRRRGEEERRRMDDERAANRERKLRAMGAKEGGSWDEGKDVEEERERRQGFRGANGGVRGTRSGMGMAGSRFAERDDAPPREFGADEFRGRGRGRGRGTTRGGRGGRGGFGDGERVTGAGPRGAQNGNSKPKESQEPPTADDFPALPASTKLDTSTKATDAAKLSSMSPVLNSAPIGKWDDEMAALDAKTTS